MPEISDNQGIFERTKELTDRLESGMKELFQSDRYRDYLKAMSHFHNYSSRNIALINMQMPGATRVASYKLWEEQFNRRVKKGEHGIRIFAPIAEKSVKEMDKLDPETGVPLLDENGSVITEKVEVTTPRFKLVPIFDISQTVGDPLPELVENLTGNVEHYEAFLDSLRAVSPLPIIFEAMPEHQDGYCRFGDKIGIREGMSETQTVAAIIHEIAHARLHDRSVNQEAAAKSKVVKEVESESIAFVVSAHYNIETSPNSFGYLAEYGSRDMSELKTSLDTIRKEANSIINALDEHFKDICHERGIGFTPKPEPNIGKIEGAEFSSNNDVQAAKVPPETLQPAVNMPDPDIGIAEMSDIYGYADDDILPLTQLRALELYDKDMPIYLLYPDNTESLAFDSSEIENHCGIFGIEREVWERSLEYAAVSAKNSEAAKESELIHSTNDMFAVYQLKDGDETRDYRFESMKSLKAKGLLVERGLYSLVYTAPLAEHDTLNSIFHRFNFNHPADFTGHSLSVSDIVVVQRDGVVTSHYVDSAGFAKLPAFLGNEGQPKAVTIPHTAVESKAPPTVVDTPTPPVNKNQPVYMYPPDVARANYEMDVFHQSRKLNAECAKAIDTAIKDSNYELYHYDLKTAAKTVIDEYGADRVAWVLANTIQKQHYDGRYSSSNRSWAKGFDIPKEASNFFLNSHPAIIDGFINRFREAVAVQEKPSILEAIKRGSEKRSQQSVPQKETQKSKQKEM